MNHDYWRQQKQTPIYPDVEWSIPERRDQAGRLGIIGGNKMGFAALANAYSVALATGVGEAKLLVPDALKRIIPKGSVEVVFSPSTTIGSLSKDAGYDLRALYDWSSGLLLAGDTGRNSETAIAYEQLLPHCTDKPVVIMRDAIDAVRGSFQTLIDQPNITLVMSFAQVQKLFQTVYYPRPMTFSMQLAQCVDALHKFTITYSATIVTYHQEHIIIAQGGEIITQHYTTPMNIWDGTLGTRIACYLLWNSKRPLEAVSYACLEK